MKSFVLTIAIIAFLNLFSSVSVHAEQDAAPQITDILITTSPDHLLLFCSIENSFTPAMKEGVQHGIPVIFTFHISLEKNRNKWFDKSTVEMTLQHTLTYDPLKEKYLIDRSEKQTNPTVTSTMDEAIGIMSEINGLRIIELAGLTPDARYSLRVKAKLAEKTLPLYMHYIIPFISLWDYETDWRTIEFQY